MRRNVLISMVIVIGALAVGCHRDDSGPKAPDPPDLTGRVPPKPPGSGDYAYGSFPSPLSLTDAEAILRRTQVFAFGGMPPKRQVQAFNVVFEQPDALTRFQLLAEAASSAGKLYALAGLLLLDPPAAVRLQRTLADQSELIIVFDSDSISQKPLSEVAGMVEGRDMGRWFRRVRDETNAYYAKSQ